MTITFSGVEIAREGDGFTDVINLSPLSRQSSSDNVRLIGSRSPFFKDTRNAEYSIKARVPYFCESPAAAQEKLFELSDMLDNLQDGDLEISLERNILRLSDAVVSAEFPDEIDGSFFEVEYEFKGGNPAAERI